MPSDEAPAGVDLSPTVVRGLSEAFVDTLAELHRSDYAAIGLGDLGSPAGYVQRQIDGWTQRYAEHSGLDLANGVFYYVYGLFKIAVIAQQIYARYKAGLTQDRRFATLIHGVRALGEQASRAIAKGRIDDLLES